MFIIRPITSKDMESFIQIAFTAGIGMTSMPKNRELLKKRVEKSIEAFNQPISSPKHEAYLFVLEDLKTGVIGGTCGITAKTGLKSPLSFYRIKNQEEHKGFGSATKTTPTLHVTHHNNYWSEICSLYLTPDFRHSGLGRLLSLSRFLFIAAFPERFTQMIFAEMRGYIDHNQTSPFWEGIGQHFIDTKFETLMQLRNEGSIDLSQALPLYPIYIELLPQTVQESIGKIHGDTKAALKILLDEGFVFSNEIDICDGGPKIEIETKKVRSIATSRIVTISEITNEPLFSSPVILANHQLNFRACLSPISIFKDETIVIPKEVSHALNLNIGDTIRYVSPYQEVII